MDYNHCTWLSLKDVAIGEMISVFNTDQDPLFSATMFNATLQKEFAVRVEGGSVTNLYFDKLRNIDISYPSMQEQKKIAAFFENIDNLITLQQCKAQKKNPAQSSGFSLETPYSTAYSSTFLTLGGVAVFLSSHGNVAFISTQNSIKTIITRIAPLTMILTTLFPI